MPTRWDQAESATADAFEVGRDPAAGERSMGSLFGDLARQTSLLFRQELALAKAEIAQKLGAFSRGAALMAAAALVAYAGFLVLLGAAVAGLALVLPLWGAALAVGGVVVALGGLLAYLGRSSIDPGGLMPNRTIRTLKDDAEWAKEQVR